jgi:hypothetical protein
LGFGERGKGRIFFFFLLGVGVPSSIHGMEEQSYAKRDRPQVVPSNVVFYFIFLRFFVCSHSRDLPQKNVATFLKKIVPKLAIKLDMK